MNELDDMIQLEAVMTNEPQIHVEGGAWLMSPKFTWKVMHVLFHMAMHVFIGAHLACDAKFFPCKIHGRPWDHLHHHFCIKHLHMILAIRSYFFFYFYTLLFFTCCDVHPQF